MAIFKKTLTEKEVKKFSEENKLTMDELNDANGGYILDRSWWTADSCKWGIVDDKTGEILTWCASYNTAKMVCDDHAVPLGHNPDLWPSYSKEVITVDDYERIFGRPYDA